MAKKRRRFTLKKVPLAAWLVIAFFAVGSMLVVSSYWSQRQAEVSQRQAIVDKKAAEKAKKEAFIKRLVPTAQAMQKQYGVLTSITLSQAILESDWGTSTLAKDYHNLFGIKGTDPATTKVLRTNMLTINGLPLMVGFGFIAMMLLRFVIMPCYSLTVPTGIRNSMQR